MGMRVPMLCRFLCCRAVDGALMGPGGGVLAGCMLAFVRCMPVLGLPTPPAAAYWVVWCWPDQCLAFKAGVPGIAGAAGSAHWLPPSTRGGMPSCGCSVAGVTFHGPFPAHRWQRVCFPWMEAHCDLVASERGSVQRCGWLVVPAVGGSACMIGSACSFW
jgi:hypothetical protein